MGWAKIPFKVYHNFVRPVGRKEVFTSGQTAR
jgi:hypothetical protein